MEQTLSTATGKLRNFKDFLVYKSLRKSKRSSSNKQNANASQGHLECEASNQIYLDDQDQEDAEDCPSQRRSSQNQNSVSLFDLVDPPMSSSRPTSMALSTHHIHAVHDTTLNNGNANQGNNVGKSVSMYALSNNDCRPSTSAMAKKSQYISSRNPAVKLFNTIKAKLGIKRKDRHNKIVDNSKTSFGSYFSSPSSSSNKTPVRQSRENSIQCDNLILSSSRSQDNILSSASKERNQEREIDGFPRALQRSTTPAISSPQINCLDISISATNPNRTRPSTSENLHSSAAIQINVNGGLVDEIKPAIPVKQKALRDATNTLGGPHSSQKRDTSNNSTSSPLKGSLTKELCDLLHYGWYWAQMSKSEAEEKLKGEPDGAFVVRDSSSDHYLLSLSFNSNGRTLHTRIEYRNGKFCFYSSETESFGTVAELIDYWVTNSEQGTFCYSRSRPRHADIPSYPVRLSKPVSRFTEVKSLAHLSRFVIRQYTRLDLIPQLPLPQTLIEYVGQQRYI